MKKKQFLIFLLLTITCKSYKSTYKNYKINKTDKEIYDILNVALESLNENKLYLYENTSTSSFNFWISELKDSNVLQNTDSIIIKHYLAKPGIKLFLDPKLIHFYENHQIKMKLNSKFLTKFKDIKLFSSINNDFYPKYYISYPILSLNKKYAWIHFHSITNKTTGVLYIKLLKNENGKWHFFSTVEKQSYYGFPIINEKSIKIIKNEKE